MKRGFLDKLIERIGRVGPDEVQAHLIRLAEEKGFLETIFDAIHEGIIVTDPMGAILYLNQSACSLFGLDRDDSMGQQIQDRIRGLNWDSIAGEERVSSRDIEVFYPESRYLNFYTVPLSLDGQLATDPRQPDERAAVVQELVGYAVILRDITESRRSTEETIESERLTALTLLAAGVAHEIGNPLNSLHIHLQLMERKIRKLPADQRKELSKSVDVAKGEIKRLDYIVTQFLRALRPAPLEKSRENINVIVRESISFLEAEIEDRDIIVEAELDPNLPWLEVDRNQLKQAFYNVIRNSFQAMKAGGILRIRTDQDDVFVYVIFSDTGGGISADNMSKLFQPYFTTKASGTGLGLLIVRRIVREHGGEIDIVSTEGQGVTLTIRLPFRDQRVRMLEAGGAAVKGNEE